jgi:nitroreductase
MRVVHSRCHTRRVSTDTNDAARLDFERLSQIIVSRRTSLVVDRDRPVLPEIVEQLCELAMWAPNHKRTWPWRFASFTGDARLRLGAAAADDLSAAGSTDEMKLAKVRSKFARTPVSLVVGSAPDDHPSFHDENRDAVAAGIQNILLGATALGLASFWSTGPVIDGERTLALCGFEPGTRIIGIIYLGWASSEVPDAPRPPLEIRHVD